jgi:RNA polymerase sigma factor (sigma-70 family)
MEEPQEIEEPDDVAEPVASKKVGKPCRAKVGSAAAAKHLAEVDAETAQLAGMDEATLRTVLREVVAGTHIASAEALVRICRQAHEAGNRARVNFTFEALSKTAAPLLLSQAWGMAEDERKEQVQEILLELFAAIRGAKSALAERFFAAFAKRRSISLNRKREARFEGAFQKIEPVQSVESDGDTDPLDDVPDRIPSHELRVLLSCAIEKLPPKHRTAFIQYHHFGMTQEEIADQNDVDVRTVHDWLKKAAAAVGLKGDDHDR